MEDLAQPPVLCVEADGLLEPLGAGQGRAPFAGAAVHAARFRAAVISDGSEPDGVGPRAFAVRDWTRLVRRARATLRIRTTGIRGRERTGGAGLGGTGNRPDTRRDGVVTVYGFSSEGE